MEYKNDWKKIEEELSTYESKETKTTVFLSRCSSLTSSKAFSTTLAIFYIQTLLFDNSISKAILLFLAVLMLA